MDERGVPLAIVITGANRHDVSQTEAVLKTRVAVPVPAEQDEGREQQNLCADAGYVGSEAEATMKAHGYVPHVRPRGEEKKEIERNPEFKPRRWIVEVAHSWFHRFRKLLVRYEKKGYSYEALTHLAAAIICFRKIDGGRIVWGKPVNCG